MTGRSASPFLGFFGMAALILNMAAAAFRPMTSAAGASSGQRSLSLSAMTCGTFLVRRPASRVISGSAVNASRTARFQACDETRARSVPP